MRTGFQRRTIPVWSLLAVILRNPFGMLKDRGPTNDCILLGSVWVALFIVPPLELP